MLWRTSEKKSLDALREENARLFVELEQVQSRFRRIARRSWEVQEDERRRLARELHDELGQVLTALVHRLEHADDEGRAACIELARGALEDVRELSRLLRPPILDDLGLGPALQWLGRRTRAATGITVNVDAPDIGSLDGERETLFFRVAQEAVTNAVKHASASQIDIRLSRAGDRVELRVRDDGIGFDSTGVTPGSGLSGMQDRVAVHDGALAVVSAPGRGTAVTVVV